MGWIRDILLKGLPVSNAVQKRLVEADKRLEELEALIRRLEAENHRLRQLQIQPPSQPPDFWCAISLNAEGRLRGYEPAA